MQWDNIALSLGTCPQHTFAKCFFLPHLLQLCSHAGQFSRFAKQCSRAPVFLEPRPRLRLPLLASLDTAFIVPAPATLKPTSPTICCTMVSWERQISSVFFKDKLFLRRSLSRPFESRILNSSFSSKIWFGVIDSNSHLSANCRRAVRQVLLRRCIL